MDIRHIYNNAIRYPSLFKVSGYVGIMAEEVDFRRMVVYCVIVGAAVGLLGAIPILRLPNICCLWIIAGGFAAAYLTTRDVKSVEMVDGAIIGAVFGIVYAIVDQVIFSIINALLDVLGLGLASRGVAVGGLASLTNITLRSILWWGLLLILNIIEGIIFGAVGGLIYAAFFAEGGQKTDGPSWVTQPKSDRTTLSRR